jgi:hypothetical protein
MKNSKTGMLKAKFSNATHKLLVGDDIKYPNYLRKKKEYTNSEKIAMFDKIEALHNECSDELSSYLYKRRAAKRLAKKREANGYVPKKKTSKAEWELMQASKQAVA